MHKLSNKVLSAVLLVAVTVVMWFFNHYTTLFLDDWHYAFIFGTLEPIRSIGDILVSQWHHYFEFTNGRFIAHFSCSYLTAFWVTFSMPSFLPCSCMCLHLSHKGIRTTITKSCR